MSFSPGFSRRQFIEGVIGGAAGSWLGAALWAGGGGRHGGSVEPGDDLFAYLQRASGGFDQRIYRETIGAANEFKEGDEILGVAASDAASRERARHLLGRTRLGDLDAHPLFQDELYQHLQQNIDPEAARKTASWTLANCAASCWRSLRTKSRPSCRGSPVM